MTITNTTAIDITFELDVNKNPLKGMQSRLTIAAGTTGSVEVEHVLMLVQDLGFQAQKAAGTITIAYSAADITFLNNIRDFLGGTY